MPSENNGTDWIKTSDKAQINWLRKYLEKLGFHLSKNPSILQTEIKKIVADINNRDPENGLKRVKNAWRKWKERNSSEAKSFSIKITSKQKMKLTSLAKENKCNASDFIRKLIDQGYHESTTLKNKAKEQNEASLAREKLSAMKANQFRETADAIMATSEEYIRELIMRSISAQKSTKPDCNSNEPQTNETEELVKIEIEHYRAMIKEKAKEFRGLHSIESPMERADNPPRYKKSKKSKRKDSTTETQEIPLPQENIKKGNKEDDMQRHEASSIMPPKAISDTTSLSTEKPNKSSITSFDPIEYINEYITSKKHKTDSLK